MAPAVVAIDLPAPPAQCAACGAFCMLEVLPPKLALLHMLAVLTALGASAGAGSHHHMC